MAGAALLALGVLLGAASPWSRTGRGASVEADAWGTGQTLEWACPSPPPAGNFGELAVVRSPEPLLDAAEPRRGGLTMAATHALPPAPPVQRPRVLVVGTAFASAAAVMVFVGLIGIYLAARADTLATGDTWLPKELTIPLQQPNTMLFTLIMSCVTMQWAVSGRRQRRPGQHLPRPRASRSCSASPPS